MLPTARDEAPYLPEQRITFDEAIHAFTMGSAFVNHLDDVTGSIVPGKLADLCVLDRDLNDRGAGPLGDAQVALTMVEGVPVYSDGSIPS
jgi:predicted amidohydrolase YtcJ